jgi:hypothetical protein
MSKTHHTTETDEHCIDCGRPFLMLWNNKEETNGRSETQWGAGYCTECRTKRNGGLPPLGLYDLNEIAKRKITKEQYYKECGY